MSFFDKVKEKVVDFFASAKAKLAITTVSLVGLVASVSAATVNFTPITELITAVTGIIPSLMDLVIALAPLIITMAIIAFLVGFFRHSILDLLHL